jgi:putative acetyltransferase
MDYPKRWRTDFTTRNGVRVVFRPEQPTDTEMLWSMFSTLSRESTTNLLPPFTRDRVEDWTDEIDYDEVLAIVAVVNEKDSKRIIGTGSLSFSPHVALKHKAELGLTVHDDYQNLGIGTALLSHLLGIARSKKLKKVYLNVSTANKRAIYLYKKAGFEVEGKLCEESFVNHRYRDEYRMAILF